MPILFKLQLSKFRPGFGATVKSIASGGMSGVWDTQAKNWYQPDLAAVREALPYHWRAAFDRDPTIWFPGDCVLHDDGTVIGGSPYLTLHDRRGNHINTIYFMAYRYQPTTQPA